jgi:hypothetical protein
MILSQLAEDRPLNVPDLYGAVHRYAEDRRDAVREKARRRSGTTDIDGAAREERQFRLGLGYLILLLL